MGSLTVRDIPDNQLAGLAEDARRNSRSMSAEVRELIAERDRKREVARSVARMREIREQSKGLLGPWPDSVALIRAVRDEE
jgi:plasmid stability protein